MTEPSLDQIAEELDAARLRAREIDQYAGRVDLSLADAYRVLLRGVEARRGRGEQVVGVKLGFTSREKARQMGVADVILGVLTDEMQVPAGGDLDHGAMIHPRVEPEIAFRLAEDVSISTLAEDLLAHVTHVAAAVEVIDSRYRNFSFSLSDVVADNTSASYFAVGEWLPLTDELRDGGLGDLAVELRIDGALAAAGSTKAILGDPLEALAAAQRLAGTHGHPIVPGGIILAGSATAAVQLPADAVVAVVVAGLGTVTLSTSRTAAEVQG
ncbi:4-oxalocrotonate decarboxylase [Acrocarpospora pleiomorpha]|uniref:4-oxalocrotonate decarboxylase n=1 Tax=Acrocarpospora pleiomorpha TaxID=90975 RepID=A0A5M3X9S3_9ACTN|nr:fumarylacetoacetate hydrolase family protein [Acrocarpospora pleiomorpha]GES17492.1 4-oxalocrotonate decarboxylase [Acrocarpospora pleiomorpha]